MDEFFVVTVFYICSYFNCIVDGYMDELVVVGGEWGRVTTGYVKMSPT